MIQSPICCDMIWIRTIHSEELLPFSRWLAIHWFPAQRRWTRLRTHRQLSRHLRPSLRVQLVLVTTMFCPTSCRHRYHRGTARLSEDRRTGRSQTRLGPAWGILQLIRMSNRVTVQLSLVIGYLHLVIFLLFIHLGWTFGVLTLLRLGLVL